MILKINNRVNNRKVANFTWVEITMKYDAVASAFSFKFPFNPSIKEQVDLAKLGGYYTCTVEHNGELLITGRILSQFFHDEPVPQTVTMSGYSLPGVLEDCEIPIDLPAQTTFMSLSGIATQYLKPFGILFDVGASVKSRMDEKYDEANATRGQSLKSFICELASQKNIIVSNTSNGKLLFTQPLKTQQPIAHFKSGGDRYTRMTLSFDGQAMHSTVIVVNQSDVDDVNLPGGDKPERNKLVPESVYRPKTVVMNSGNKSDKIDLGAGSLAARNAIAHEMKSFTLDIGLDKWDINGKIVRPGIIVSVTNPNVYLFKITNWFVEQVLLTGTADDQRAVLRCVLPEVYNGTIDAIDKSNINKF